MVTTRRRSDADIQRQVDTITRNARRNAARSGGGAAGVQGHDIPDRAWRQHMNRMRADEQFQRDQDSYYARQRYFERR